MTHCIDLGTPHLPRVSSVTMVAMCDLCFLYSTGEVTSLWCMWLLKFLLGLFIRKLMNR